MRRLFERLFEMRWPNAPHYPFRPAGVFGVFYNLAVWFLNRHLAKINTPPFNGTNASGKKPHTG